MFRHRARWKSYDIKSSQWLPAHSVNIRKSIGRRYLAELKGVIHNRREKINGLNQSLTVAQTINAGVIGAIITNQQIRVRNRREVFEGTGQKLWP